MDHQWNLKQTQKHLEMIRKAQSLLRGTKLDENQLRALMQINTLESFLEMTLESHKSEIEWEKKKMEIKK